MKDAARYLALVTLTLGGCHLVFPYSSGGARSERGRVDGSVVDGYMAEGAQPVDADRSDARITCPEKTWCVEAILPSGTPIDLNDVWGASATSVYAVGGDGTAPIAFFRGASATWGSCPITTSASVALKPLTGVWVGGDLTTGHAFAVSEGAVYHGDGKGLASITTTTPGASSVVQGIWGASESDLFAVGWETASATLRVWHGQGIQSWTEDYFSLATSTPMNAVSGDASEVWAAGNQGTLVKCRRADLTCTSMTWTVRTGEPVPQGVTLRGVWVGSAEIVAVGECPSCKTRGIIVRRLRADGTWTVTPTASALRDVWGDANAVYAVGDSAVVLRLAALSDTWETETVNSPVVDHLNGVWGDNGYVVAVGGPWIVRRGAW